MRSIAPGDGLSLFSHSVLLPKVLHRPEIPALPHLGMDFFLWDNPIRLFLKDGKSLSKTAGIEFNPSISWW